MTPTTVAQRRWLKSSKLSQPFTRWSVLIASGGGLGNLPGYPWFSGALFVSIALPFALWPLYVWGGAFFIGVIALALSLIGTAALMDIHEHGTAADFDARPVVIDEFAGAALTLALGWPWLHYFAGSTELFGGYDTFLYLLYLGLLFRVFDIAKPWPASWLDVRWHNPFSIIADDLVAAFYAALVAPLPFVLLH